MIADLHTHSEDSHDSVATIAQMAQGAKEKGVAVLALTNHIDRDCLFSPKFVNIPQMDLPRYIKRIEEFRKSYFGETEILFGAELGYDSLANELYKNDLQAFEFDIVINSVHNVRQIDVYYPQYFDTVDRHRAFEDYLKAVRESLDAPYRYDIVAHIGYISRKAPYGNKLLTMAEFGEQIDDILTTIIKKDKCLEVNTNVKTLPLSYLPGKEILTRYYQLGGRKITFGSDAHMPDVIARNYAAAAKEVKEIGFDGFLLLKKGKVTGATF